MRLDRRAPVGRVLGELVRHPVEHLLRKWNYKSAITSSVTRGVLFFVANLSSGQAAAIAAMSTEFCFRFVTAGFYGALTQTFRRVDPPRVGTIAAIIVLPAIAHSLEWAVHAWRGTANLGWSIALSLCFTAFSTAFNLFAMRHGALVVGEQDSRSFFDDLRAMPRLVVAFVKA
ncbi:MAG TPA: hypothetical protein VNJ02_18655 [Vicinamibacterales bacterium]|nr:hypothetical protein [Vicinamibacterales bacterium]